MAVLKVNHLTGLGQCDRARAEHSTKGAKR